MQSVSLVTRWSVSAWQRGCEFKSYSGNRCEFPFLWAVFDGVDIRAMGVSPIQIMFRLKNKLSENKVNLPAEEARSHNQRKEKKKRLRRCTHHVMTVIFQAWVSCAEFTDSNENLVDVKPINEAEINHVLNGVLSIHVYRLVRSM
jgi:hypothetical protein